MVSVMPHQPMVLTPKRGERRRIVHRGAPEPEFVVLRDLVLQQRLHAERDRRGPGAVVLQRHVPEPAGGKPRLDHAGRADPQRSPASNRPARWCETAADRSGARRLACRSSCAALILAPHSALAWVHSTAFGRDVVPEVYCTLQGANGSVARRGRSALSANSDFETVAARRALRGRGARIMRDHRDPAQAAAMGRDQFGISRLGDRGDRAAMAGEIFHLGGRRAGVGGDRDGAEFDAGKPGQHGLDAIVEMDQDIFAGLDAAFDQARGQRADAVVKFAVRPAPRRRLERRPDQERMVAAALGCASAAATARRGLRMVRRRPALAVKSTWFLPRSLWRLPWLLLGSSSAIGSARGANRDVVMRNGAVIRRCEPLRRASKDD